jgi:hypothetical protein
VTQVRRQLACLHFDATGATQSTSDWIVLPVGYRHFLLEVDALRVDEGTQATIRPSRTQGESGAVSFGEPLCVRACQSSQMCLEEESPARIQLCVETIAAPWDRVQLEIRVSGDAP